MTTRTSPFRAFTAAVALTLAFAASAAGAKDAGKVLFVAGAATAERTPPVTLKAGDAVLVGDTIATGDKTRVQILMNDGARIALRANSRYRVDEFGLPASVGATQATATQAEGVSVATLLKGGFRTATGAIGKDGKGSYEVRTPIGTLGIRGTDYTAIWCQGDCADVPGVPALQDGLYLAVHEGAIVLRQGDREVEVRQGEFKFTVALANTGPSDASSPPAGRIPAWMLTDSAGALDTGASGGQQGQTALPDLSGRRDPPTGQQAADSTAPDPSGPADQEGVQRPIRGTVGGQQIDLTRGTFDQRNPNSPPGTPSLPPPSNNVPPPPPSTNVPPPGGG